VSFRLPNDPTNESGERTPNVGLSKKLVKGWKEDDCEVVIKSKEFDKDFIWVNWHLSFKINLMSGAFWGQE